MYLRPKITKICPKKKKIHYGTQHRNRLIQSADRSLRDFSGCNEQIKKKKNGLKHVNVNTFGTWLINRKILNELNKKPDREKTRRRRQTTPYRLARPSVGLINRSNISDL